LEVLDHTVLNRLPRCIKNSCVFTSESQAGTKRAEPLQLIILLEYMSSWKSGNTEILDEGYRRPVSVCGRQITVHINLTHPWFREPCGQIKVGSLEDYGSVLNPSLVLYLRRYLVPSNGYKWNDTYDEGEIKSPPFSRSLITSK
jgi:hypothetical protein